ncbi:MAG: hypothetical protein WC867_08690 [Candidatus Pacearchaeota archaeon]|jgi:hypothetical protein
MKKGILIGTIIGVFILIILGVSIWFVKQSSPGSKCALILENNLNITGQPRDACYIVAAEQAKDENLCEKVSLQEDKFGWNNRNSCYTRVAILKKDISLCEKVTQYQQKETCTNSVNYALSTKV